MNPSGFGKGLLKYAVKTVVSFVVISALFLAFSNMESLREDPAGTAGQIFEMEKDLILHPRDTISMLTGGGAMGGMPALKDLSQISDVNAEPTEYEQFILMYTNIEREKAGLGTVEWSGGLALPARGHSKDMIERDFFEHENPDGEDPTDRFVKMYDYAPEKALGPTKYIVGVGENLGKISFPGTVEGCGLISDTDSIAACQVQKWMESPYHRANILDEKYTHLGVGAVLSDDTYLSTQVFW
jgi:uncharacterized protein YkwD